MPAPTSGLARITIRAPRRRLDLAVPDQVPLAEVLPELLRRAGESADSLVTRDQAPPPGGWTLRRADGVPLGGAGPLAAQGVRDGDVLYLVPRSITWPEPEYDDVVEEIADGARRHGRNWDPTASRLTALAAAALMLLAGGPALLLSGPARLVAVALATGVTLALLGGGVILSRALGDSLAGAAAGGFALPYAAAAGALAAGPSGVDQVLVGGAALLFASVLAAVGVGHGLRIFTAAGTVGGLALLAALLGLSLAPDGVAAIGCVALVAGIGAAPAIAVRAGRLPLPVVSSSPVDILERPDRAALAAAVIRADEVLVGLLLGLCLLLGGGVAVLVRSGGVAATLLAALTGAVLVLRARLFPAVAARLPLLVVGLLTLAGVGAVTLARGGPALRLAGAAVAMAAVAVSLGVAVAAYRRRGGSPYLGRLADIVDVLAVVGLAPLAGAVLDLFSWIRDLVG